MCAHIYIFVSAGGTHVNTATFPMSWVMQVRHGLAITKKSLEIKKYLKWFQPLFWRAWEVRVMSEATSRGRFPVHRDQKGSLMTGLQGQSQFGTSPTYPTGVLRQGRKAWFSVLPMLSCTDLAAWGCFLSLLLSILIHKQWQLCSVHTADVIQKIHAEVYGTVAVQRYSIKDSMGL